MLAGDTKSARTVEIRDFGTGLTPEEMPNTILSLNESNKITKHYLAGAYGQGGSTTYVSSTATFIASRRGSAPIGFTVVRFEDLPAAKYKVGHYVYLTLDRAVLLADGSTADFPDGTLVRHFGYDLSGYTSPLGPTSLYGLMNLVLFDPVMPVWLDNRVHDYRRVIKGARNALNGALDEGDEGRGSKLSHRMPMLYVPIGEYGRIGIEYWALERPDKTNKKPTAAFVNPSKPIVLTLNGQTHEELSQVLIGKDSELPYLTQRLIGHVDCNSLTPTAVRALFVSNREGARRGMLLDRIKEEVVRALRSDDELTRLNNEARDSSRHERDESAIQEARRDVARLLRLQGMSLLEGLGGNITDKSGGTDRPAQPRGPHPRPQPIDLHEPPTYIKIVWDDKKDVTFYPEQRRYIRIETDAESSYHNPNNATASRINIIISNGELALRGSSPLQGGRMRALFDCVVGSRVGGEGTIRVELSRLGLPVLASERRFVIVKPPPAKDAKRKVAFPPFEVRPVDPEDPMWQTLGWPDDIAAVASAAVPEDGVHVLYYSTVFPPFRAPHDAFERSDPTLAQSFEKRYRIRLVVHSLLHQHQQQERETTQPASEGEPEQELAREREERIRMATLAAMFASREVQTPEMEPVLSSE